MKREELQKGMAFQYARHQEGFAGVIRGFVKGEKGYEGGNYDKWMVCQRTPQGHELGGVWRTWPQLCKELNLSQPA